MIQRTLTYILIFAASSLMALSFINSLSVQTAWQIAGYALISILTMSFGQVRKSILTFSSGTAFALICLESALPLSQIFYPLILAMGLIIGIIVYNYGNANRFLALISAAGGFFLLRSISVNIDNNIVLYSGICILLLTTTYLYPKRYRRQTIASAMMFLYFTLLVAISIFQYYFPPSKLPELSTLLSSTFLLLIPASFIFTVWETEFQMRTVPVAEKDVGFKDALTNIYNRRALDTFGPQLTSRAFSEERAISIIMADIDHFKHINDMYGHANGDLVLKAFSALLTAQVRESDLVTRYGGEEFVIVLPGASFAPVMRLAEQIRKAVMDNKFTLLDGNVIQITSSVGVTTGFPEDQKTFNDLLQKADKNLYKAKRNGRNQVQADSIEE